MDELSSGITVRHALFLHTFPGGVSTRYGLGVCIGAVI